MAAHSTSLASPAPDAAVPHQGALGGGLAAGVLIALVVAALWARRRAPRAPRRLEVLESLSLGPRRSLCLVHVSGRQAVLGVSEAGVQLLMSWAQPPAGATAAEGGFEALLAAQVPDDDLRARLAGGQSGELS